MPHFFRKVLVALLVGLVLFALYYPYKFLFHMVSFAFTKPELWQSLQFIEPDTVVGAGQRWLYFLVWLVPAVATMCMIIAAIRVCMLLLQEIYFERRTIRAVQWVGIAAVLAGSSAVVALSLNPWMLTLSNVENVAGPRWALQSSEVGVLLAGFGILFVSWVLRLAMALQTENQEFV